ncbi:MAG: ATP-dependent helicase [Chloroflexi bacterium]|nr:ATP-dependent helicase [Chloroflexota bacterium]
MTESLKGDKPNPIIFTPEQAAAVECLPPQLIIAGAGTGKTTVLTEKLIAVIREKRADAGSVLGLTFTDKAAGEMAERVRAALTRDGIDVPASSLNISTFHSFGEQIVRENLVRLGINPGYRLATRGVQWDLLTGLFNDLTFDAVDISLSVSTVFSNLLDFFGQAKDHMVAPEDLLKYLDSQTPSGLPEYARGYWEGCLAQWRDVQAAYVRYEEGLREREFLDFGDLLRLPVKLFLSSPAIRQRYLERFKYIFVDEYQDTNAAQAALLSLLINQESPNVVVIGDDDQAIYQWRGAMVDNILNFDKLGVFGDHKVAKSTIVTNRRSYPPILDLAQAVINPIKNRHEKRLGYHHATGQAEVGHYVAATGASEAQWIAGRIESLLPWAEGLDDRKHGWGAFAVLCRKRAMFPAVAAALDAAGIPYELIGGTGFYDRPEIKDILSYLMVITDPGDNIALARILISPRFRLSDRDIFFLGQWKKKALKEAEEAEDISAPVALIDALSHVSEIPELSPQALERLQVLRDDLDDFTRQANRLSIPGLALHILDRTGYRWELEADSSSSSKIALLNLQKMVDLAAEFQLADSRSSLSAFVQYVKFTVESEDIEGEVRPVDEDSNTVKVMSVHQAKGLEFPCVFIPGLVKGYFPTRSTNPLDKYCNLPPGLRADSATYPSMNLAGCRTEKDFKREEKRVKDALKALKLEEERRLCYVAVTRAQFKLFFSRARWYGTAKKEKEPSVFWEEMVQTGLADDLGVEGPEPEILARSQERREETREESMSKLLLDKEAARRWLNDTVDRAGMDGHWEELKAGADRIIATVTAEVGTIETLKPPPVRVASYSALACYRQCPAKYRYAYIDRLPSRPSPAASVGTDVHELIRRHALGQQVATQADFDELAGSGEWLEGAFGAAGRTLFDRYLESVYARRRPQYVEQPFNLRIGGVVVRGRIDRLDHLPDGSWEIVDFKTGRYVPSPEQAANDLQLRIYALAAREIWGVPEDKLSCTLFYLQHGRPVTVRFGPEALEQTKAEVLETTGRIDAGLFPRQSGSWCTYCDFGHLCAWEGEGDGAGPMG